MIRALMLSLLVICSISSKSQDVVKDFQKYTYFIFGWKNNAGKGCASGFFLKKNNKVYFITAGHVITQIDPITNLADPNAPDSMRIRVFNNKNQVEFFTIIRSKMNLPKKGKKPYAYPDVYKVPITRTDLANFQINYLNDLYDKYDVRNGTPDKIYIYGFDCSRSTSVASETVTSLFREGTMKGVIGNVPVYSNIWGAKNQRDTLNYLANLNVEQGFSGAPVLFKFIDRKTQKVKYTFGGILSAKMPDNSFCFIVRPEYVK